MISSIYKAFRYVIPFNIKRSFLVPIILLSVSLGLAYQYQDRVYHQYKQVVLKDLSTESKRHMVVFYNWLQVTKSDVRYLAGVPSLKQIVAMVDSSADKDAISQTKDTLAAALSAYVQAKPDVTQARFIGSKDNGLELVRINQVNGVVTRVQDDDLQEKGQRDYFKAIAKLPKNDIYVSDITLNRERGEISFPIQPTLRIGLSVYDAGHFLGALILNIDMRRWLNSFAGISNLNNDIQVYLINTNGGLLIHPDPVKAFGFDKGIGFSFDEQFEIQSTDMLLNKQAGSNQDQHFVYAKQSIWLDNQQQRNISLFLTLADEKIYKRSLIEATKLFIVAIIVSVFGFILWLYFDAKNRIKKEQAQHEIASKLTALTHQLVESSPVGQILVNQQGLIEMVNQQVSKLFGYQSAELIGQPVEILVPTDVRQPHEGFRQQFVRSIETRRMGADKDLYAQRKNGTTFPVEIGLSKVNSLDGVLILAVIVDMTSHRNLLDELSKRNAELNSFAYIASHDLRSPLRGINQLAIWLEEDLADTIDPESIDNLRLMRNRIDRMENLLNDLLTYAKAGKNYGDPEHVDVELMLKDTFELYAIDSAFSLEIEGKLPVLTTLKTPLDVVFRNLINNAIKHHDKGAGVITVSALEEGEFIKFSIQDDGPGIDASFREQVFGLYQTLRPRDEVEGSGMGLAIIKKIIETFGGTITIADSANGSRGAVFIFTWPIKLDSV